MRISGAFKVSDLQKRFSEEYSLLQLRMYKVQHEHFEGSKKKDEVKGDTLLTTLNTDLPEGIIELTDSMTVDELETKLEEDYGLHAQVFRKSGDIWLQTSSTDEWTLRKHADKAKEAEAYAHKE